MPFSARISLDFWESRCTIAGVMLGSQRDRKRAICAGQVSAAVGAGGGPLRE